MSDQALKLIQDSYKTKDPYLDLGNCGLTDEAVAAGTPIDVALRQCTHLTTLILSNEWYEWDENGRHTKMKSSNTGEKNKFSTPPPALNVLIGLQQFICSGDLENKWGISDMQFVVRLTNLILLNLSNNQIAELKGLDKLTNLTQLEISSNLIAELKGLDNLTNLTRLGISHNQIAELKGLGMLTKLTHVEIINNRLAELKGLEKLTHLTQLYITRNQIAELKGLDKLTKLALLDIGSNQIAELKGLDKLTKLTELDINSNKIAELKGLEKLTNLTDLDISSNQIAELKGLDKLTKLTKLGINSNQISELEGLEKLANLTQLYISKNQIAELKGLDKLTNLTQLYITQNQITELKGLDKLTNLTQLTIGGNQIAELKGLDKLTKLTLLDIAGNQITELKGLDKLTKLTELGIIRNQIAELKGLDNLTKLEWLNINGNQIKRFDEKLLTILSNLTGLGLRRNPIENIKAEIIGLNNCLPALKTYFNDLKNGAVAEYEAKLILIGNGRVGKTCLVNRWLNDAFNEAEKSTHSINLRSESFPELAARNKLDSLRLNIWDFGGQDIYHATHRYFMQTNALFLLVWDANTETIKEQAETLATGKSVTYKNLSIRNWLSYIKSLSNNSPVIIVQTQRDKHVGYPPAFTQQEKIAYNIKEMVAVESSSADADNGFDKLQANIASTIAGMVKKNNAPLPTLWFSLKEKIWNILEENNEKEEADKIRQIGVTDFEEMCRAEGLDEESINVLLQYFHDCGLFYYKKGLFGNRIVLDQQWAIDAVYRIFNREDFFAENHPKGKFTGADLNAVWSVKKENKPAYTIEEQELLLSFMLQCEICFETDDEYDREYLERSFIAPQLLPVNKPTTTAFNRSIKPLALTYKYRHQFLQSAIIQRFIVRCGRFADEADMWQQGILIEWQNNLALIEAFPDAGEIAVKVESRNQQDLLNAIRNEIKEITKDETGIDEFVSFDGDTFVSIEKLKKLPAGNEEIQAENGEWVNARDYRSFLNPNETASFTVEKVTATDELTATVRKVKKPDIFVSYAWSTDRENIDEKEKIVTDLYTSLGADNEYQLHRDITDISYKGLIDGFMKKIGEAEFIIVVISDKYLRRPNCMFELYEIYRNSRLDVQEFKEKIFPVYMEPLSLGDPETQKIYIEHWKTVQENWEQTQKIYGGYLGDDQSVLLFRAKKIYQELGNLLTHLNNINAETKELLTANNFDFIKKAIKERAKQILG